MHYDIFLSYSSSDRRFAESFQHALRAMGKRWADRRKLRVFLDASDLAATPVLWRGIETAITQSRYLVVIASPRAAQSEWVSREIRTFKDLHGVDRILIVLHDGVLAWNNEASDFDWSRTTALPKIERLGFSVEPKYVDARLARDAEQEGLQDAAATVAATVLNAPKSEIFSLELKQHTVVQRALLTYSSVRTAASFTAPAILVLFGLMPVTSTQMLFWLAFPFIGFVGAILSGLGLRNAASIAIGFFCVTPFYGYASYHGWEDQWLEPLLQSLVHILGWLIISAVVVILGPKEFRRPVFAASLAGGLATGVSTHLLQRVPPYCAIGCDSVLVFADQFVVRPTEAFALMLKMDWSEHGRPWYWTAAVVGSLCFGLVLGIQLFRSRSFHRMTGLGE